MDETGEILDKKFYLEVVAFQPTFYDIGNTCTEAEAGTDIMITVTVFFIWKYHQYQAIPRGMTPLGQ